MKALVERLSSLVASQGPELPIYWVRNGLLTLKEDEDEEEERGREKGDRSALPYQFKEQLS